MSARDELFHYAVSRDMLAEEGAAARLDAYRREVLAEAIEAVKSKRLSSGSSDVLVGHEAGVRDAIDAIANLAARGAR